MTDVRTGAATPVAAGPTPQGSPSVSPDGSKIVFTAGGPDYDLVEVPLDGSPMRDFLATGSDEYSGAWVPGSSRYVYLTNKNGEEELRIHSQTENWDRLIVVEPRTVWRNDGHECPGGIAGWPACGLRRLRCGRREYRVSIWISPVGGGDPIKLTPEGATERAAAWSPDGQSIVVHPRGRRRGWTRGHPRRDTAIRRECSRTDIAGVISRMVAGWRMDRLSDRTHVRLVSPDGARQRILAPTQPFSDMNGDGGAARWSGLATARASTRPDEQTTVSCRSSRSTPRPGPSASSARSARMSISPRRATACASRWRPMARASSGRSCARARTCGSSKTSRRVGASSTGSAGDDRYDVLHVGYSVRVPPGLP